ncbi:uncharacterized protein LOC116850987 isoform X2 [Odontomachus brunneus]|nr:uncharacterized protein LOC116850987 isoform X2 [Odontomachus brunneus]XP_032685814.1 uncharacterized protein LOC116850987 isoform X2 [Odontomachus brunneus]XP_032685816.1 uncharacterized protein LOC116850987 isoform X2 [Odontomachus brunneus]
MNSCDEDLFAISDEEISGSPSAFVQSSNPIEKYLTKQLVNVQNRIETTTNNIEEVKATTGHILNVLQRRVLYGQDVNLDIDSDLYTIEGEPIIKRKYDHKTNNIEKSLEIIRQWQCVLHDKWIIGVELKNRLQCCKEVLSNSVKISVTELVRRPVRVLKNLKYYPCVKDELEIRGESMFWQLREDHFWQRINAIHAGTVHVVATTVLDLPVFARESIIDCWGTISYEIDEIQFQTLVPLVRLSVTEIIDCSWTKFMDENKQRAILALKSTSSTERIVTVQLSSSRSNECDEHDFGKKRLFRFLAKKTFEKIYGDVFSVKAHGPLTYCLLEILSINFDKASLRIFFRSSNQLHIILHLLQDEFSNMMVEEKIDNCVEAAMALMRELELIRNKKSILEIQDAKLITDLLIP